VLALRLLRVESGRAPLDVPGGGNRARVPSS
jgi:hypothetical protein